MRVSFRFHLFASLFHLLAGLLDVPLPTVLATALPTVFASFLHVVLRAVRGLCRCVRFVMAFSVDGSCSDWCWTNEPPQAGAARESQPEERYDSVRTTGEIRVRMGDPF